MTIFYDAQLRRYVMQFAAIFQGLQWENGSGMRRTIPVKWAAPDRQVQHIQQNNSENTVLTCPAISIWISGIEPDDDSRQGTNIVETLTVTERNIDPATGTYGHEMGSQYTVERLMPIPFKLKMQVDIWTSNMNQKLQILEQIMLLTGNPLDIQTSVSPVDWTARTTVHLDGITWSSRSIPVGTDSDIDVMSFDYNILIKINPPVKMLRANIIQNVITNFNHMSGVPKVTNAEGVYWDNLMARIITTPGDHKILVEGNVITLLSNGGSMHDGNGNFLNWHDLMETYGVMRPAISQLRLKTTDDMDDHETDIVGTVEYHPTEPNKLLWGIDSSTLKPNTLPAVTAVVDPLKSFPGNGSTVLAHEGKRYLIVENDIAAGNSTWGGLAARANDIVEFHNGQWTIAFNSRQSSQIEFIVNSFTGKQLKWSTREWILSIDAEYNPGYWRLFL